MSRWAIPGVAFQTVWVNPETWKTTYDSAAYLRIGDDDGALVHVLLPHDSVPVGSCLEHAPGLKEDRENALSIEAVGNFLKSRQRIDFIRLSRAFPNGNRNDFIEPHVVDGLRVWQPIGDKPPRRGEPTGLLQPGAFREPTSAEYAALRGPGLLVTGPEAEEIIKRLGGEDLGALERLGGDDEVAELVTVDQVDRAAEFMAEVEALPPKFDAVNAPASEMPQRAADTMKNGDMIIVDDPLGERGAEPDTVREATVKWFQEQIPARLHDKDVPGTVDLGGLEVGHLELPKKT